LKLPIVGNFKLLKILNDPGAPVSAQPIVQREINPIEKDELPF
jgi:hypothetical protein